MLNGSRRRVKVRRTINVNFIESYKSKTKVIIGDLNYGIRANPGAISSFSYAVISDLIAV